MLFNFYKFLFLIDVFFLDLIQIQFFNYLIKIIIIINYLMFILESNYFIIIQT